MAVEPIFKSVGRTIVSVAQQTALEAADPVPLGIKTPLRAGSGSDGVFAMHTGLIDQISDNLRNLVLTNHGERLGLYDFGANLQPLMTELVADPSVESEAMSRIRTTAGKYMPHVSLETFSTRTEHSQNQHTGKIVLRMTYGVPTLNISGRVIEVVFYVM